MCSSRTRINNTIISSTEAVEVLVKHFESGLKFNSRPDISIKNVLEYFKSNNLEVKIFNLVNELTQKHGIKANQAEVNFKNRDLFGLNVSFNNRSGFLSLMELFERFLFQQLSNEAIEGEMDFKASDFLNESPQSLGYFNCLRLNSMDVQKVDSTLFCGNKKDYFQSSSGAAIHTDLMEAINRSVFEIVERDALMRGWLEKVSPNKVKLPDNAKINKILEILSENDYELRCFVYQDLSELPVFSAMITSTKDKSPYLFPGGGCHVNPMEGLIHAIDEAFSAWTFDYTSYDKIKDEISTEGADQHKLFYGADHTQKAHFYLNNSEEVELSDIKVPDYNSVLMNLDLYFAPKVFTLDEGHIYFVKAFSPKMFPMFFGELPTYLPKWYKSGNIINNYLHPY